MKQKPILFSTAMVQAILSGRKTQTRRVINPQPDDSGLHNHTDYPMSLDSNLEGWIGTVDETGESKNYGLPFYPGNVLWVKETFYAYGCWEKDQAGKKTFIDMTGTVSNHYHYSENPPNIVLKGRTSKLGWYKRPSIFMPLYITRIWLEITEVTVHRLQDISKNACIREGVEPCGTHGFKNYLSNEPMQCFANPYNSFISLWESINGQDSWLQNPWVWVIKFKRTLKP